MGASMKGPVIYIDRQVDLSFVYDDITEHCERLCGGVPEGDA